MLKKLIIGEASNKHQAPNMFIQDLFFQKDERCAQCAQSYERMSVVTCVVISLILTFQLLLVIQAFVLKHNSLLLQSRLEEAMLRSHMMYEKAVQTFNRDTKKAEIALLMLQSQQEGRFDEQKRMSEKITAKLDMKLLNRIQEF